MRPPAQMILVVKKLHLDDACWELRHGRHNISAEMEDRDWLRRFRSGQEVVRPGDALRCIVEIESHYGPDNELLAERHAVIKVLEVMIGRMGSIDPTPDRGPSG